MEGRDTFELIYSGKKQKKSREVRPKKEPQPRLSNESFRWSFRAASRGGLYRALEDCLEDSGLTVERRRPLNTEPGAISGTAQFSGGVYGKRNTSQVLGSYVVSGLLACLLAISLIVVGAQGHEEAQTVEQGFWARAQLPHPLLSFLLAQFL